MGADFLQERYSGSYYLYHWPLAHQVGDAAGDEDVGAQQRRPLAVFFPKQHSECGAVAVAGHRHYLRSGHRDIVVHRPLRFGGCCHRHGAERHVAELRRWRDDSALQALQSGRLHRGAGICWHREGDTNLQHHPAHHRCADHHHPQRRTLHRLDEELQHREIPPRGLSFPSSLRQ